MMQSKTQHNWMRLIGVCCLYALGGFVGLFIVGGHQEDELPVGILVFTIMSAPAAIWLVYKLSSLGSIWFRAICLGLLASGIGFIIIRLLTDLSDK